MSDATTTSEVVRTNDGPSDAASQHVPKCPNSAGALSGVDAQVSAALTDAQQRAVYLMFVGTSLEKIAKEVGVDRRTIYRWRHESEPFRAALERVRRYQWEHAADRLRGLVSQALDVLTAEVVDEYDRSRVRAAAMILQAVNIRKLMTDEMARREE